MEATDEQVAWLTTIVERMIARESPVQAMEPQAEYKIRQESSRVRAGKNDRTRISTWRFWFRWHEVLMPAWLGTEFLVYLLTHQGKNFSAAQLTIDIRKCVAVDTPEWQVTEILNGDAGHDEDKNRGKGQRGGTGEGTEPDVILDKDKIKKLVRQLNRWLEEKTAHEKAGDSQSTTYLKLVEDIEKLQTFLRHNTKQVNGKLIPKEYQKGTPQLQADAIRKHIRRLLDKFLKRECRALFDHLNDRHCLKYGLDNCYCPKPRIAWEIEFKEEK